MADKNAKNKAIHAKMSKSEHTPAGRKQSYYRNDKNSLLKGKFPENPKKDDSRGAWSGQQHMKGK